MRSARVLHGQGFRNMAGTRRTATPSVERILVPLDFSGGAGRALERAAWIAATTHCEVHLLHVLARESTPAVTERLKRAFARAQSLVRERSGHRCRVQSQVRSGDPYVQIIRRAREIGAELIVLGRNRAPGLLGTTLTRVVHMSDVPTLIVRRRARGPYRRPLVAVEIDPCARNLISLSCHFAGGPGPDSPTVRIVHAYQVPFAGWHRAAAERSGAFYARQSRREAERSLAELLGELSPHPCAVQTVVRAGDPLSVIMREAGRSHADLVTVGTHGRSGIAHALLGSVAEKLVAAMGRDVLVARPVRFTFVAP